MKIPISKLSNLSRTTKNTILLHLFLWACAFFMQLAFNFYYFNNIPPTIIIFNIILLFVYLYTNLFGLIKLIKLDIAKNNIKSMENYNNSLTSLYDSIKCFKHDFDNIINIISGYIQVNDINGLKQYFSSLEKDCIKANNIQLLNPDIINNPGIYNLIVTKYKKAEKLGITINIEIFFNFHNLHTSIYEFSRILGILLDNAIEAANDCDEKIINLIFRETKKQNIQIVIIENTYKNKNIDTKKIFEKGISEKQNHSGIGLWKVNQIIMKHNNIILNTTHNEKFFRQELQIYN